MAHVQTQRLKLWKPQSLSIDKIDSQKMFIDNINTLETFALSVMKRSVEPVSTITELKAVDTSDTLVYVNGTTIIVKNKGLYFFDRNSTASGDDNMIVVPTNGGGRWISDITFVASMNTIGNIPNVTTNNQTPTYTTSDTLTTLISGEKLSIAMGKIKKSIDEFITHKNNTSNPHSVTKSQVGLGNVPNVVTNDQTPTYTQASTLANLVSGEKLSVSMGKIMRAIAELGNKYTKDANVSIANGEIGTAAYSRLTGFVELNNKNLNDYKFSGQYGVSNTCTNRPSTTDPYGILEVVMCSSHWVIQRYYALNDNGVINGTWYRSFYNGSTWTPWSKYTMDTFNVLAEAEVIS